MDCRLTLCQLQRLFSIRRCMRMITFSQPEWIQEETEVDWQQDTIRPIFEPGVLRIQVRSVTDLLCSLFPQTSESWSWTSKYDLKLNICGRSWAVSFRKVTGCGVDNQGSNISRSVFFSHHVRLCSPPKLVPGEYHSLQWQDGWNVELTTHLHQCRCTNTWRISYSPPIHIHDKALIIFACYILWVLCIKTMNFWWLIRLLGNVSYTFIIFSAHESGWWDFYEVRANLSELTWFALINLR
jgi:hypothetical protein